MAKLPVSLKTQRYAGELWFDTLGEDDVIQAYHVMLEAAETSNNVGLDEYANEQQFHERLDAGHSFAVISHETIQSVIVLGPCRIARGVRPCLCEIQIFFSRELFPHSASILKEIVPVCERIAVSLDMNYTGCVIQLSVANSDWLKELRQLDYVITACLPRCVDIKGQGLIDSLVLYKKIADARPKEWAMEELSGLPEVTSNSWTYEQYQKYLPKELPGLPLEVEVGGVAVICRPMRPDEDQRAYDFFMTYVRLGMGYSMADAPTLGYFRKKFLACSQVIIMQKKHSDDVIAVTVIRPSPFVRHTKGHTCAFMGIRNNAGGTKLHSPHSGNNFMELVAQRLGYRYLLGTAVSCQYQPVKRTMQAGYTFLGSLPDGIYLKGEGWTDVLFYSGSESTLSKM